jgi:glycosyltransferase involved in cell wall biosynthesis
VTPTVRIDMRRSVWRPEIGISRYSTMLVKTIAAMPAPPVRFEVLTLDGADRSAGTTTRFVGSSTHFLARLAQEQLRMPFLTRGADLLHLPWYEGPVISSCPLIVNIHDLDTLERAATYSWRFRLYYNNLLRAYVRTARKIIVPSLASLAALEHRWPGRPYVHIPYGIDAAAFAAPDVPKAAEPTILYSGGYGARKRLPDLLQAFGEVARSIPSARLILTGNPPPEVTRGIEQLQARAQVESVGVVPFERLVRLYAEAWVVAYPSALEGFGFPVLEAFASGTPVVAAASGSIPEVAGDAAILVSPRAPGELGQALTRVLRDEAFSDRLSAQGRLRAEEFSWQETASRTLAAYEEALAG